MNLSDSSVVDVAFSRLGVTSLLEDLRRERVSAFLVGGAVRDLVLDTESVPSDIDLMVAGGLEPVRKVLEALGPPRVNRHKNLRYLLPCGTHLDVMDSRQFYGRTTSVAQALEYFDVSANALAASVLSDDIMDPLGARELLANGLVTLPAARWILSDPLEDVHVLLRAMRLVTRLDLRITNPEVVIRHRAQFDHADWRQLERLNGFGQDEAVQRYESFMRDSGAYAKLAPRAA